MYHYVYRLDHIETMEYYIGSRSSKLHPSLDSYLGSMKTWNPDKSKLIKTIIKMDFPDRNSANDLEYQLIKEHINNSLNRNYAMPSVNWGYNLSGDKNPFFGKNHSNKSREKMSESAKNREITEENEKLRKERISKTMKGIPKGKDFSKNMSLTRRGEDNPYSKYLKSNNLESPNKGKKYERTECPYCNRMISISVIHISHLDNCKYKINGKG